jgi:hypothetical protein
MRLLRFFRCVGQAILHKGLRGLAGLIPLGEFLWDVAEDTCKRLHEQPDEEVRAEVQAVAQADAAEVQRTVATVVAELAGEQSDNVRQALSLYLSQVPDAVRQSNKRPADPSGRTVAAGRSFREPEQILPLLPPRLPRFKVGDRPLPGVNWQLVELLGVGGFGEVWKAHDPDFDGIAPVALKFCLDPESRDRLLRHEALVLNRVMRLERHDGIVPLRKQYLNADPPCLEYEYVGGGDLSVLVRDLQRLKPDVRCEQARQVMQRLAQAVAYAHEQGIVHRDLKPANILLEKGAGTSPLHLRITDFGIGGVVAAQALAGTRIGSTRSEFLATALRGAHTPLYASPQQMRGSPPDPRDDVHALGVIWYQLLTGDLTTGASADFAVELADLGVPAETIALLGRCLSARAERRPATAAVLAREIAALGTPSAASVPRSGPIPPSAEVAAGGEPATRQGALAAVRAPALALLLTGVLGCLVAVIAAVWGVMGFDKFGRGEGILFFLLLGCLLVLSVVVSVGALRMRNLQSYRLALLGGVLAIFPGALLYVVPCAVGIWVVWVLTRNEVRSAFRARQSTERSKPLGTFPSGTVFRGPGVWPWVVILVSVGLAPFLFLVSIEAYDTGTYLACAALALLCGYLCGFRSLQRHWKLKALYDQAQDAFAKGDYELANNLLNEAITLLNQFVLIVRNPNRDQILLLRGLARDRLGLDGGRDFERAVTVNPTAAEAHFHRGNHYYRLGNHAEAITAYLNAVRLDPHHARAYYNRGSAYLDSGNPEQARLSREEARRLDPDVERGADVIKARQRSEPEA